MQLIFLSSLKIKLRKWKLAQKSPEEIFTKYYNKNKWGDKDSKSGKGSNLQATEKLIPKLSQFINAHQITSMIDLPCGDFFWMQHVELQKISYTGADIVPRMISENQKKYGAAKKNFLKIDLIKDQIPHSDLIFCRDCLVHLSSDAVKKALMNIKRSGSKWLLTTTFPGIIENGEIVTGEWRKLDLTLPPFELPLCEEIIFEGKSAEKGQTSDKALGLWKISDIPNYDI